MTHKAIHLKDMEVARDTLQQEARALQQLADQLGESFSAALDIIIARANGRVVISGMGKSGHVGKKIAATLASTGTPSFFIHPAEASHGDLGMVTDNDTVIALSKSGESIELRDIINYCKRFNIPLIGVTQKVDSSLGRQADIALLLPDLPEACPNQQAPTTSTTLTMALGDALAVGLMKRRGFSATDFRQFHPGGKLGGQLLAVRSVMIAADDLPCVQSNQNVTSAMQIMSQKNLGCAIIIDEQGLLVGFVSDGDLRRHFSADLGQRGVTEIMATTPRTIASDALSAAALAQMNSANVTQLVVVEDHRPIGLIRLHDLLRAGAA